MMLQHKQIHPMALIGIDLALHKYRRLMHISLVDDPEGYRFIYRQSTEHQREVPYQVAIRLLSEVDSTIQESGEEVFLNQIQARKKQNTESITDILNRLLKEHRERLNGTK